MRHYHKKKSLSYCPTINLEKIWGLVSPDILEAAKKDDGKEAPIIDVTEYGFHKVLGTGSIPKASLVLKARQFSKGAEKKIKEAGGVCVLTA